MGIFGAGNAGAAVTNLAAPLIIVAFGWRAVPQIYSVAMLAMAVLFWFCTYPDPKVEERRKKGKFPSLIEQLAPLSEMRVWRFCLAYYFVFGGFVALALWLPKYYVTEYGLTLQSAAFITMFFTLPSGLIRALGGWISDKFGGSTTTGGCSGFIVCLFSSLIRRPRWWSTASRAMSPSTWGSASPFSRSLSSLLALRKASARPASTASLPTSTRRTWDPWAGWSV
jgi:NNP family nitrate/nitrite transporter-like MFS transporter